jgi:hypothetical protein
MHQLLPGLIDIAAVDIKKPATGNRRLVIGRNRRFGCGIGRASGVVDECQSEQASEGHNSMKHGFPPLSSLNQLPSYVALRY